ncbi:hypothetical protein D3C85_779590 [compost metagenome]
MLALGGHVRLELGQLVILELDQTLQLVHLALQIAHATLQLFVLATGGVQAFLGDGQLVAEGLAFAVGTFVTTAGGLAAGSGDQSQAVLGIGFLGRFAGTGALGCVQLALALPCQAATFAPGGVLRRDLAQGLRLAAAGDLLLVGQPKHLATLQAVDVAVEEGVRVQVLDGQHGLVDRAAGAGAFCDLPQGIAGGGAVLVGRRLGRRGRGGCRGGGWARRGSGSRRCGRHTADRCRRNCGTRCRSGSCDRNLRRGGYRGLRRIERRIQQQGVFAQQAAVGPEHFDEKIQIGFADRLARGHPDDAAAIGFEDRGELEVRQEVLAIDPGLGELLGRRQARLDFGRREIAHFEQFDLRDQRLVQGGAQGDFPKPERMGHTRSQRGCGRDCQHKFANPNHRVIPLFYLFSRCARGGS